MELPGSGSHGGTMRPREQYAQPGFHGVHLTCLWRCHGSGSGLSQLGKRQVVCLSEQTERSRDTCMSQLWVVHVFVHWKSDLKESFSVLLWLFSSTFTSS